MYSSGIFAVMVELTDEAKAQIKVELDKWAKENEGVITDNKQIIADLTFYKWILRGIFAVAFGGTIAGLLTIPSWIDKFVVDRVKVIEDLVIANESLQAGDYRSASDSISNFLSGLGGEAGKPWDLSKLSDPQKRLFFSTLLQVLSTTADYDPTALTDFKYKDRWRAMLADQSFPKFFSSDGTGYSNSATQNWAMGIGYLRYGESADDLAQAYRFINHVNESASATDKATGTQSWSPLLEGLVLALQDKRDEAVTKISSDASILQSYLPYELTFRKASTDWLLGDYWGQIFNRLWTKFGKSGANDACALFKAAYIQASTAQTQDFKDPAATTAFIKVALDYYAKIQSDINNKNFDHLNSVLERPLPDSLLTKMAQLDGARMSAKIYQVLLGLGATTVVVRFFPTNAAGQTNTGDSCLGFTPASNHEEYWVFRKTNSPDHDWRIATFAPPIR
jgi:hypothetical protein